MLAKIPLLYICSLTPN